MISFAKVDKWEAFEEGSLVGWITNAECENTYKVFDCWGTLIDIADTLEEAQGYLETFLAAQSK